MLSHSFLPEMIDCVFQKGVRLVARIHSVHLLRIKSATVLCAFYAE